jgi:hypothetical protein
MPNQFVTKTCLTTYTYMTTYIHDGQPKTESREKVISNIATEDRNTIIKIIPTSTIPGITLTQVFIDKNQKNLKINLKKYIKYH